MSCSLNRNGRFDGITSSPVVIRQNNDHSDVEHMSHQQNGYIRQDTSPDRTKENHPTVHYDLLHLVATQLSSYKLVLSVVAKEGLKTSINK